MSTAFVPGSSQRAAALAAVQLSDFYILRSPIPSISSTESLESNYTPDCFQILFELFRLFFLHVLLEHGRGSVRHVLGFLQAEVEYLSERLDGLDLLACVETGKFDIVVLLHRFHFDFVSHLFLGVGKHELKQLHVLPLLLDPILLVEVLDSLHLLAAAAQQLA